MKVVLQCEVAPGIARRIASFAADGLDVVSCADTDDKRFRQLLRDADVLWHILMPIGADHIAGAPKLRLIQKIGVGVNTIDLEAAKSRGIAVCNMPGTNSRAVAEMALLLMMAALKRLAWFDQAVRAIRGWPIAAAVQDNLGEIGGRTVGLVGYGASAQILAPILKALGARVLYTARSPKPDAVAEWRGLPDLLAESDVVSLHVPLTDQTKHLIDDKAIARMKPGAVLVNTARGGLVDQPALARALKEGRLGAAGLDVFAEEPVQPGNPLLGLDNVVLAPHVAWLTVETWERSFAVAVENCRRIANGGDLLHRVA